MAAVSSRTSITPPSLHAAAWSRLSRSIPAQSPTTKWGLAVGDRVLVVAAHPDDETLGAGATIAQLCDDGVDVHVVSLTAGEAVLDHVGRTIAALAQRRRDEFHRACAVLGAASSVILDLPDTGLQSSGSATTVAISEAIERLRPAHLLTVWWDDPHADHQAAGHAARQSATAAGCPVSGFPIWALHWSDPAAVAQVTRRMTLLVTSAEAQRRRREALDSYTSQTLPLADDLEPILPPELLTALPELVISP